MNAHLLFVNWDIDPVFFSIGPVEIRYYGLLWALTFGVGMILFMNMIKREGYREKMFDSIFWFGTLSTIIGARLGHCLFYEPEYYLTHPVQILNLRQGGLASHGAAIGLLIGLWLFSRKNRMPYIWSLDRITLPVAVGGAFVRLGNLLNSEIYGTATSLPWGFIFVRDGQTVPMHPTQIYEALAYLAIFALLMWMYYKKDVALKRPGVMFGWFLILLFTARFFIEFIKNPQEDFEVGMSLYMGQILSIPFILAGVAVLIWAYRKPVLPVKK
ncbi:MAG: prolipoprotein diacylglyceryl transferase [Rikenellaceae bacterium]|nr:prolipoprotein diacylglyceryl transferase [Rikenellaceae bacterium]